MKTYKSEVLMMTEDCENAMRILQKLRTAQDKLIDAMLDMDDCGCLMSALTQIGDTMDSISALYNLPIMSEQ